MYSSLVSDPCQLEPATNRPSVKANQASVRTKTPRSLHRISAVRRLEKMSLRNLSRRWGMRIRAVRREECSTTDLPLSALYRWQKALGVPVAELLVESDSPLAEPILARARLVKIMKTAATLKQHAASSRTKQLTQLLVDQLVELMPELAGVSPWQEPGASRIPTLHGRRIDDRELGLMPDAHMAG